MLSIQLLLMGSLKGFIFFISSFQKQLDFIFAKFYISCFARREKSENERISETIAVVEADRTEFYNSCFRSRLGRGYPLALSCFKLGAWDCVGGLAWDYISVFYE